MPRKGIICPVDGATLSDHECLACRVAKTPPRGMTHRCDYSSEMLRGMMTESEGRETAHISATNLSGCARQKRLEPIEDYYLGVQYMYPRFRGTLGHLALEKFPDKEPGTLYETRFEMKFPEYEQPFTGKMDKVSILYERISDGKSKPDAKIPAKPEYNHILQLNVYKYLVYHGWPQVDQRITMANGDIWDLPVGTPAEIEINDLQVNYFGMDGKAVASFCTAEGDMVPVLSEDEVLTYIHRGMSLLSAKRLPPIPEDLNPHNHPLCTRYCGLAEACIEHLGKASS